jgi:hypothetical protein
MTALDGAPLWVQHYQLKPKQLKMMSTAEQLGSVVVESRDRGMAYELWRSLRFIAPDPDGDGYVLTPLGCDALERVRLDRESWCEANDLPGGTYNKLP